MTPATAAPTADGEQLLGEVFELLQHRLPSLPVDDPCRPALTRVMPQLAELLGRPHLIALPGHRLGADDAGWMLVADAAHAAASLPGVTRAAALRFERLEDACRRAAGEEQD